MAKLKIPSYYLEEAPETEFIKTYTPILDLALSGSFDKGYPVGIIQFAGESGTFKSMLSLLCASAYLHKKPNSKLFFYDGEGGAPQDYFKAMGIPTDDKRVIVSDFTTVEDLIKKVAHTVNEDKRLESENSVIVIDGIGMAPSNKELNDAIEGNDKQDMTRAKALNSLFRIITPMVKEKNIPVIVVNHSYQTIEMFSKVKLKGGEGSRNSSTVILHITKSKEKEGKDLVGYSFNITPFKSRYIKEGVKLPLIAKYGEGIEKYSGLFDLAKDSTKNIVSLTTQSYQLFDKKTGKEIQYEGKETFKRSSVEFCPKFWKFVVQNTDFKENVEKFFKLGAKPIVDESYFNDEVF